MKCSDGMRQGSEKGQLTGAQQGTQALYFWRITGRQAGFACHELSSTQNHMIKYYQSSKWSAWHHGAFV